MEVEKLVSGGLVRQILESLLMERIANLTLESRGFEGTRSWGRRFHRRSVTAKAWRQKCQVNMWGKEIANDWEGYIRLNSLESTQICPLYLMYLEHCSLNWNLKKKKNPQQSQVLRVLLLTCPCLWQYLKWRNCSDLDYGQDWKLCKPDKVRWTGRFKWLDINVGKWYLNKDAKVYFAHLKQAKQF